VTVEADRVRIIERKKHLFGRIDGVIYNAGYAYRAPASETSVEDFRRLRPSAEAGRRESGFGGFRESAYGGFGKSIIETS
jgi:hypothetical protein